MVSISGSKKLKRQMAPTFWGISRKDKRFVVTARPGPHPKKICIPSAVLLRDTLGIVRTLREAKWAIYSGRVRVDGTVRRSLHHGAGLMDVVRLEGVETAYRLVPKKGALLHPRPIPESEADRKLCKVTSKNSIKGGRTQLGFHDGRTSITDAEARVGDTCVLRVPSQEILDVIPMKKDATVMVTGGANAGSLGSVTEVLSGTFRLPKRALVSLDGREIDIQTDNLMAVGAGSPALEVA